MNHIHRISSTALAAALAALALAVPEAGATTFCVPTFSPACTNADGRVAEADLEKAMGSNASDGVADEIVIAAGTVTENGAYEPPSGFKNPGAIEPAGSDPLTVVGAAAAATTVTSSGSGNIYVLALGSAGRVITMRDLTVRIPAGFPDGLGAAVQLVNGDKLDDVDIVSLNPGSDGVGSAFGAGNLVSGGEIRGESGGSVDDALRVDIANGRLLVVGTVLKGVSWGLISSGQGAELTAFDVVQVGTRTYGVAATSGLVEVVNSVIGTDDGIALYSSGSSSDSRIIADHVTAANSNGATNPALEVTKVFEGTGDARIEVSNSILRGYGSGYRVFGVDSPGVGEASLAVRYSNFQPTGTNVFGALDIATGNIDVDPGLNPDGSLPAGSPSIDAADPAPSFRNDDILEAPRPVDGNGDCVARNDQGAFEFQLPVPPNCEPTGEGPGGEQPGGGQPGGGGQAGGGSNGGQGGGPAVLDRRAPQTSIVKGPGRNLAAGKATFKLGADEAARYECQLDRGKRRACAATKSFKNLAPGRHTFKAWAIDAAGNADATPAKRSFRVLA